MVEKKNKHHKAERTVEMEIMRDAERFLARHARKRTIADFGISVGARDQAGGGGERGHYNSPATEKMSRHATWNTRARDVQQFRYANYCPPQMTTPGVVVRSKVITVFPANIAVRS